MEDAQPNEFRLARKGSTSVPCVRPTRPAHKRHWQPYPHDSRPSKRPRWQPHPTRTLPPSIPNDGTEEVVGHELVLVSFRLPPECRKDRPGSCNARKKWIEDLQHHLQTNRYHSVLSFKYSDDKTRVLFTCRTREPTGSHTKDDLVAGSHSLDAENLSTTRQGAMASSIAKVRANHSDIAQGKEPCPSYPRHANPRGLVEFGDRQHVNNQLSFPSSGSPVESNSVESPTAEIRSYPLQTVHTKPFRRHSPTLPTMPPTTEEYSTRWTTFRSGYVDVCLPPLSGGPGVSSLETIIRSGQSTSQTLTPVMGQTENMPVGHHSNIDLHSALPETRANDPTPVHLETTGPFTNQLCQRDVLEVVHSSHIRDLPSLEGEERSLALRPDYAPPRSFTSACGVLSLPLGPHDKPRHLLHSDDFTYVVTAHGTIDRVSTTSVLKLDCNIRSPSSPLQESVDDACMQFHEAEPIIILGHAREQNQISLLNIGHGQIYRCATPCRDWNTTKKSGVSAVASLMSPLKFASGGYDHRVHIWDIAQDVSGASAVELAIKHASAIHSLLPILDTSHKLVSVGADRDIPIYDMSAERVMQTLKVSCVPYHAHRTDSMFCTLLEVSHLETQFEVRDHRTPNRASERFGFITEERRGRFDKAYTWSHFVACGDKDGMVHLWDFRNVSKETAVWRCFNDPVIRVVHSGPRLLVCSRRNELVYVDFEGG